MALLIRVCFEGGDFLGLVSCVILIKFVKLSVFSYTCLSLKMIRASGRMA